MHALIHKQLINATTKVFSIKIHVLLIMSMSSLSTLQVMEWARKLSSDDRRFLVTPRHQSSIHLCFTYPSCDREKVGYTLEESNFLSLFVYNLCVGVPIQPDVDVEAKMPNYLCCSTTSTSWIETSRADVSFSG